jgi:hypothetical protein
LSKSNDQAAGFTLFAFAWAMAGLFHQLSFEGWRWYDFKGIILTAAILSVLFKPSSWKRFAVLITVDLLVITWTFPYHPNHIVFSWVVNGTILASLLLAGRQHSFSGDIASEWYRAFAPWIRIELCVLYFFTVFHKLNTSYFTIDWSCAAQMHREISAWMPLLPDQIWAQNLAIYGTLIIETAIPVMLFFGRTRVAGVVLGMIFHGLLALHPHAGLFSFSATMTALFTAFIPLATSSSLRPNETYLRLWKWVLYFFSVFYSFWILRHLLPAGFSMEAQLRSIKKVGFLAYYIYLGVGLFLFIRSVKTKPSEVQDRFEGRGMNYALLLALPLLLIVNGFGPYFGLRTQTSFSMFSNLHTENGMTNHLIMPSGIQITNWQYDLVEILDSNHPDLIKIRDSNLLLVYLDLRRERTIAAPDFWVTYRRNGKIETFDSKRPETHRTLPSLGLLARRYFFFRPVERDPITVRCKH